MTSYRLEKKKNYPYNEFWLNVRLFQLQTSLQLGSKLLKGLGVMSDDVSFLRQIVRDSMELQAQEALSKNDEQESNVMEPLQVLNNLLSKKCE